MSGAALHRTGVAGDRGSPVHRLDPRAKLAGLAGITVVGVSTPLRAWPAFVACAVTLAAIPAILAGWPRVVWSRTRVIVPLVVFVAAYVPFRAWRGDGRGRAARAARGRGSRQLALVSAKATIGAVSAILLSATTSVPTCCAHPRAPAGPRLLVVIAAFMYRSCS